jgi:hypothetical protein
LIFIITIFLISGCSNFKINKIDYVGHYTECSNSIKPTYEKLAKPEDICSPSNSEILTNNLIKKETYIHELEGEVDCYRTQAKASKELEKKN